MIANSAYETAGLLLGGGGVTLVGQTFIAWLKERTTSDLGIKGLENQIEEHRDELHLELLRSARIEMAQLRAEASELRPLLVHAAHLEEALDHLHDLLNADSALEIKSAEKRAKAFLRRMRGPDKGERRNEVQSEISAARIINDASHPRD